MLNKRLFASPSATPRIAGVFYLVTAAASLYEHFLGGGSSLGQAARLLSGSSYLTVIWLLYQLLRPADQNLAMIAAFFGIVGVARSENSVAFFGVYSCLVGVLIIRSTFIPPFMGVVMMLAGLGLLMTTYGPLLRPNIPPGVAAVGFTLDAGEIVFALWLTIAGVSQDRWRNQATIAEAP